MVNYLTFFLLLSTTVILNVLVWYTISGYMSSSVVPVPLGGKNYEDAWNILEATVPSAPVGLMRHRYWNVSPPSKTDDGSCFKFPQPWDLLIPGQQWQLMRGPHNQDNPKNHLEAYLYSAHFDDRVKMSPAVRILTLIDRTESELNLSGVSCLLWNRKGPPVMSDIVDFRVTSFQEKSQSARSFLTPYMVSCSVTNDALLPEAVSLVPAEPGKPVTCLRHAFDIPTNCLKVNKKMEDDKFRMRPRLAVCVKGIFYPDPSAVSRLVEWLELQFILGVEKIFVHYISLSPEALAMLKHYEQRGLVVLKEVVWAGPYLRHWQFQLHYRKDINLMTNQDNMVYNDCFYTAMEHNFDFVATLDPDEVIMPLKHQSLPELLIDLEQEDHTKSVASYTFRNTFFMDSMKLTEAKDLSGREKSGTESSETLHMLDHLVRTRMHTQSKAPKSILRTSGALVQTTMSHLHSSCIGSVAKLTGNGSGVRRLGCPIKWVKKDLAHLAHYRNGCSLSLQKVCDDLMSDTVVDDAILRFRKRLVEGVARTLSELGLSNDGKRQANGRGRRRKLV